MNVLIYNNDNEIGIAAGNYISSQVLAKPDCVLGLATGSTPIKTYQQMIKLYNDGAVDFSKVTTFNLDEYVNLDVEDKNFLIILTSLKKAQISLTATQKMQNRNVLIMKKESKRQAVLTYSFSA